MAKNCKPKTLNSYLDQTTQMATTDSSSSSISSSVLPLSPSELNESRTELFSRIQSLKRDLQSLRSNLDTQVTCYKEELVQLRKSLNVEVVQLRSEFQGLRTTLHQQQEDVTACLRNLGLQDLQRDMEDARALEVHNKDDNFEVDRSEKSTGGTITEEVAV